MRSSTDSIPTDRRTSASGTSRCEPATEAWVITAGSSMSDSTPPSDSASVKIRVDSQIALARWARHRQERTGKQFPVFLSGLGLIIGIPFLVLATLGFPISFETPQLRGFNFVGGIRLIPEFIALLIALSTYTAAFIAEVVRAGVQSVARGQTEAALGLGFKRGLMLRLIVVPQALRVILPPLTNQYLNLTKNSTLGVAIGYPDLFGLFAGTTLSQTGQAIEIIGITMGVYLLISLVTSAIMSFYGWRLGRSLGNT